MQARDRIGFQSDSPSTQGKEMLQYTPVSTQQRLPLCEAALLVFYHLRLLNWWLFLLVFLGFLGSCALLWFQLRVGNPQGSDSAAQLSRFVMESGAGLLAGVLVSSLLIGDPLLEVIMTTCGGIYRLLAWRTLLTFFLLLLSSAVYLLWSLGNGVSYASQQSPLFLLLVWLAPALVMGALGLFGSLLTRNAALGMVIASVPLMGALFLYQYLLPLQATHPFFIPYTSWGYDASDWWTNRLTLLSIAAALVIWIWWWLRCEERLLGDLR
jgi:hypothetical protein